jgi:tetratricopeptide (TPR) repeat protein
MLWTILLLVLGLIVLRGRIILAQGLLNVAFGGLNDQLAVNIRPLPQSDSLWQQTLRLDGANPDTRRALGFLYWWQGQPQEALVAWQHVDGAEVELLNWGNIRRQQARYEEALEWYQATATLSPDLGDPWYYSGQIYQTRQQWAEALQAYETAVHRPRFLHPLRSDAYFQLGFIQQSVPGFGDLARALLSYDQALKADSFSSDVVKAEAFYKRGEIYSWQGADPALSLAQYRQAVALYPGHNWARLRMGDAIYHAEGDLVTAVAEIEQVIAIWQKNNSPYLKSAYIYLGGVYRAAGQTEAALAAFILAATLDPSDTAVQAALNELEEENR